MTSALNVLSYLAAQADIAVDAAGLTTLETLLLAALTTLAGALGVVWKWGNGIRKEAIACLEARNAQLTELVKNQTQENKDVVHALQGLEKTLERIAARVERGSDA